MFFRKKLPKLPPAVVPVELPLEPVKLAPCCVLYAGQIGMMIPTIGEMLQKPIGQFEIGRIIDTLRNSCIVPPKPWPQVPHRFEQCILLPSDDGKGNRLLIPAFVFYPS